MKLQSFGRPGFALAIMLIVLATSQPSVAGNGGSQPRSIAGSWDASIDFFGTVTRAMYSFHRDGTLTEADNPGFDPGFNGDALSPGIGAWKRISRRDGIAKYQKFAYDAGGQLTLIYVSTIDMELNRDGSMTGSVSIVVSTPVGDVVSEIPDLPFTATRIEVDF